MAMSSSNTKEASTVQQFGIKIVLSGAAAFVAETATYPLDLCKTRLQLQGEHVHKSQNSSLSHAPKRGLFAMGKGIVVEEGVFTLWKGLSPALYRHLIYTSARMVSYEVIRDTIVSKSEDGRFPVWMSAICGMTAGGLGQFLASPADLVKVQMQMEGRRKLEGLPTRYRSVWHAFSDIYAKRGIRGLWRGWAPNVQRAALVNMGDLTTYDSVKRYLLHSTSLTDNWFTHFISSCCSGLVAACISSPADVVKARVMNQPHDELGRPLYYKSSLDCLRQTVANEGFFALYKGFVPCYTRMAPWSLLFWLSYEEIRKLSGVSGF